MSDPRWFKLFVRGIGLMLVGSSLPGLAQVAVQAGVYYTHPDRTSWGGSAFTYFGPDLVMNLLQTVIGIYLLAGAPKLVRYCIGQVGLRCASCDYDIRGVSGKCPECGLAIPEAQPKSS